MNQASSTTTVGLAYTALLAVALSTSSLACSESESKGPPDGGEGGNGGEGGDGGGGAAGTCAQEKSDAAAAVSAANQCEAKTDCRLLLTVSGSLSLDTANNRSGYVVINTSAEETEILEAAKDLSSCEGDLGPEGVGLDEDKVACSAGRCTYEQ